MVTKRELAKLDDDELMSEWTRLARESEALRADLRRCRDEFEQRNLSAAATAAATTEDDA